MKKAVVAVVVFVVAAVAFLGCGSPPPISSGISTKIFFPELRTVVKYGQHEMRWLAHPQEPTIEHPLFHGENVYDLGYTPLVKDMMGDAKAITLHFRIPDSVPPMHLQKVTLIGATFWLYPAKRDKYAYAGVKGKERKKIIRGAAFGKKITRERTFWMRVSLEMITKEVGWPVSRVRESAMEIVFLLRMKDDAADTYYKIPIQWDIRRQD